MEGRVVNCPEKYILPPPPSSENLIVTPELLNSF